MLAIVVSRADSASEHVGEQLLDLADWREASDDTRADEDGGGTVYRLDDAELRTFDPLHLELDRAADAFDDPDLLVFASRHAGETGPLLTAHHTGNFGPAEYGGEDGSLARACPNAHRRVVRALDEYAPEGYEVGMECTHHGPTDVGAPSMFVEVGSDELQWADPDAARAVARAILELRGVSLDAPREDGSRRHLVGFGGGHYAPRFERVVRETDWSVGHVAADWCLEAMGDPAENRAVVRRAFETSAAEYALLESDRPALETVVEDLGYRVVSETWVRETSGVSLALVERLEGALASVDEGLRFGDLARDGDRESGDAVTFEEWRVPGELLAEARGIDGEATMASIAGVTVAYTTEQNGTQIADRVAVPGPDAKEAMIDALADVLRQTYDEVTRDGDELVARKREFDPTLAREEGVSAGPEFGRLADGDSVEVDGRTVRPEAVHTDRERRFNC